MLLGFLLGRLKERLLTTSFESLAVRLKESLDELMESFDEPRLTRSNDWPRPNSVADDTVRIYAVDKTDPRTQVDVIVAQPA